MKTTSVVKAKAYKLRGGSGWAFICSTCYKHDAYNQNLKRDAFQPAMNLAPGEVCEVCQEKIG
jgi:hypothetical protein